MKRAYQEIPTQKDYVLLTGKTCTGKTSTCKYLEEEHGYFTLSLDKIVRVIAALNQWGIAPDYDEAFSAYKNQFPSNDIRQHFIDTTREIISNHPRIVVEGAISSPDLIHDLFDGYDYAIVYILPDTFDIYYERVLNRLISDLEYNTKTLPFWSRVPESINESGINNEVIEFLRDEVQNMQRAAYKRMQLLQDAGISMSVVRF